MPTWFQLEYLNSSTDITLEPRFWVGLKFGSNNFYVSSWLRYSIIPNSPLGFRRYGWVGAWRAPACVLLFGKPVYVIRPQRNLITVRCIWNWSCTTQKLPDSLFVVTKHVTMRHSIPTSPGCNQRFSCNMPSCCPSLSPIYIIQSDQSTVRSTFNSESIAKVWQIVTCLVTTNKNREIPGLCDSSFVCNAL